MMNFCARCETSNPQEAKFCQHCGAGLHEGSKDLLSDAATLKGMLEARKDGVLIQLGQEFRKLRLRTIFPFKTWLKDRPWSLVWVKWFLFFGLFPLVLVHYYSGERASLDSAAWTLSLYFAALWGFVFRICLLPEKINRAQMLKVFCFTMFFCIALVALALQWSPFRKLYDLSDSGSIWLKFLGFTFGVGLLEESIKGLPIYLFMYRKKLAYKPSTYAFIGALSGLAFGVSEAVVYSVRYALGHSVNNLSYGDYILVQFLRMVTLPFLHALWAGLVGYFIGLAQAHTRFSRILLVVGMAWGALLHGLYNTFAGSWIGVTIGALSLLIFVSYIRSQDSIGASLGENGSTPSPSQPKEKELISQ